ncbi:MAG: DNA-directed RNA polymerase subunit omega [Deltaproteobacteria bacterium]|nr:DNA-directed RNA polymerase subunit omega [Deltaproteobacteria bacterium]
MARVTVEDCLTSVDNRFALVMVAAKRTKQLLDGSKPRVTARRDKAHVLALREIADGKIKVIKNSAS